MRILILTTQVPFVHGGAEILAAGLRQELQIMGHDAEIVAIPFKWYPAERIPEHMLVSQLLDVTEACGTSIDLVIGLKFPAYLIPHSNKVMWLVHQHRMAYDLWLNRLGDLASQPNGSCIRDMIINADKKTFQQCRHIYTIANNVSKRLKEYCNIDSSPLYHPPAAAEKFYCEKSQDYFLFPSRLAEMKRQKLILEALACTNKKIKVVFIGKPESPSYENTLVQLAKELKVTHRVEWLGEVSEEKKRHLYACSRAVIYPPMDEDYGYVTLEAMLSHKPLITTTDSGGPLEFVQHLETGFITEPTAEALAIAMEKMWSQPDQAKQWGEQGFDLYQQMKISWKTVIRRLLS